jgi:hypothetical protein
MVSTPHKLYRHVESRTQPPFSRGFPPPGGPWLARSHQLPAISGAYAFEQPVASAVSESFTVASLGRISRRNSSES